MPGSEKEALAQAALVAPRLAAVGTAMEAVPVLRRRLRSEGLRR